ARTAVPEDPRERTPEQQAGWLLAHMLDWHRREDKAPWWEDYRLRELTDEGLLDEKAAPAGPGVGERVGAGRGPDRRARVPEQETSIREESKLELTGVEGGKFGVVTAIDLSAHTVDVKKTGRFSDLHPTSVFAHQVVGTEVLAASLMRLGDWVANHGIDAP